MQDFDDAGCLWDIVHGKKLGASKSIDEGRLACIRQAVAQALVSQNMYGRRGGLDMLPD